MNICQNFAKANRDIISRKIIGFLNLDYEKLETFETIHNYINLNDMILRKGAIAAYNDQLVMIPINMRDGCIIGKGKSNPNYNYSAPHGAGRLMSRQKAKDRINLDDFKKSMSGIYSSSIDESTIDESPFAYKPIDSIISNITYTVDIIKIIKPVYNYKHSDKKKD